MFHSATNHFNCTTPLRCVGSTALFLSNPDSHTTRTAVIASSLGRFPRGKRSCCPLERLHEPRTRCWKCRIQKWEIILICGSKWSISIWPLAAEPHKYSYEGLLKKLRPVILTGQDMEMILLKIQLHHADILKLLETNIKPQSGVSPLSFSMFF
jgi:hypothetical protein